MDYVRFWAQTASHPTNYDAEWSDRVIGKLNTEWENAKLWSISINRGDIIAARKFW